MNKDIRPMTDEERQRAKERAMANKAVRDAHKRSDEAEIIRTATQLTAAAAKDGVTR